MNVMKRGKATESFQIEYSKTWFPQQPRQQGRWKNEWLGIAKFNELLDHK